MALNEAESKRLSEIVRQDVLTRFDVQPIQQALGDDMPDVQMNQVGRMRLVDALSRKFGENFRAVPAAGKAIEHFDSEMGFFRELVRTMMKGRTDGERSV